MIGQDIIRILRIENYKTQTSTLYSEDLDQTYKNKNISIYPIDEGDIIVIVDTV